MRIAIVGAGNVGTDLLEKVRRSSTFEVALVSDIDPNSPGLGRARSYGVPTSTRGIDGVLEHSDCLDLVCEATTAAAHRELALHWAEARMRVVNLTPASLGLPIVPAVNLPELGDQLDIDVTTCGGQAAVPIVAGISAVAEVEYAEAVSAIASRSAGLGTRQDIDELPSATASVIESVGGAKRGKGIFVLSPAEPASPMRTSVFCLVSPEADRDAIVASLCGMEAKVRDYVPGYRIAGAPSFEESEDGCLKVSVLIEVTGAGDFLPPYAGNLDLLTTVAVIVVETLSRRKEAIVR